MESEKQLDFKAFKRLRQILFLGEQSQGLFGFADDDLDVNHA
jgi:hypothetical protein